MTQFTLQLISLAVIGAQGDAPRCIPSSGRKADVIRGEVASGDSVLVVTPGGWILRLRPGHEGGWFLEVSQPGRESEDLSRLTPPWHFVPNAREIEGWHFRNKDNTARNDGSVNAPQAMREFIFSPQVGRDIEYNGSATTPEDVAKVESFGRGWLRIEDFRLTPPRRGERAAFEWLKYTACLTWPAGYRPPATRQPLGP